MRIATFSVNGEHRVGIVTDAGIIDATARVPNIPAQTVEVIRRWSVLRPQFMDHVHDAPDHALHSVRLHAPIVRPGKIFAIGINYADHCAEAGLAVPTQQVWFSKAATSINGPFDPIELPAVSEQLDHECEMVAVVGQRCRNISADQAHEVIFGYCVGNDVSVRDWQTRTPQWVLGKSFDTHAPIGPWITTADEIDPHALGIRCLVNGERRQQSNTRNLIFNVFQQVAELSQAMTLEPGDLIFTGTCGGVGFARKPPLWLKAGDVVRVEIDHLGAIENVVVPGARLAMIDSASAL